jgi:hypothetical protein
MGCACRAEINEGGSRCSAVASAVSAEIFWASGANLSATPERTLHLLRVLIKPRRATTSPHIVDQGV